MQNNEVSKEETIMGLPISEVRRQCSANREFADKSDFGPINRNANPLDICIEGSNEIINRNQEIESIQESKKLGKFSSHGFQSKKNKEIHYLNMEEKKQMLLNGEHIPIQVGESNFNEGPVKYYSRTLKKKMKL